MVGSGDRRQARQERRAAEHALRVVRVQPDLLPLVRRERRGPLPDEDRHRQAADIVDEGAAANGDDVDGVETAMPPGRRGERRHTRGVADQVVRRKVGEVAHCSQGVVDSLALECHLLAGLVGEDVLPDGGAGLEREDLRRVVREPVGDRRVEGAARSLSDDARGELVAAEHALEGGITGDVCDSHRERDLVTPGVAHRTLAVPALGGVGEQRTDGCGKAKPIAQHLSHLAELGDETLELPAGPRELACGHDRAYRRRASRWGERAHDSHQRLRLRAKSARSRARRQFGLTAEELRCCLRTGRAAHIGQEAHVVRLRGRV